MELSNNSNEMKTLVETFVIEETASLIYDNEKLDKWNELVNDLGLKGQTKIVEPEKSPIPFMFIKTSMRNIFETLCPRKVSIQEYDVTPIPVEILDLAALSIREKYFSKIQIWYDDKDPDPLCIGIVENWILHKKGTYTEIGKHNFKTKQEGEKYCKENKIDADVYDYSSSRRREYLLGKWADVKHSFEELKEIATKKFISIRHNEYQNTIKVAQRGLDDLQSEAFGKFN